VRKLIRHRLLLPAVLAAAVLVVLGPAAAQPAKGEKVALLVGITEYDHSKLPNLQYAEADVEELADVLRQSGYSRIVLLTNRAGTKDNRLLPVRENIQRELAGLLAKRTKRDTLLVAFAGHGVQLTVKGKDEPFFCPQDGNPTRPDTLVALNQVYAELDDSGAGVKLLLVDARRNNPADRGSRGIDGRNLPELREGMGALFSCRPGERSYEHKDWKHGAFFSVVLEALRRGADGRLGADVDGDGVVDFGELSRYVSKHVPARVRSALGDEVEQHPLPVQTVDPLVAVVRLEAGTGELPKTLVAKAVDIEFVLIPAGTFLMGSPEADKKADKDEKPRHKVTISKPFYLGKTEVTVAQFRAFVKNTGYTTEGEKDGKGSWGPSANPDKWEQSPSYTWRNPRYPQGDDHPMVCVSWNDAKEFCAWLGRKDGRAYRLPTEAEWEYACRAGSEASYCFGDDPGVLDDYAWSTSNSKAGTQAVGKKKPNRWGLCDMHGNVWEWCEDSGRDYDREPKVDPFGTKFGTRPGHYRALRGGSWENNPATCRAASRPVATPEGAYHVGFRVACAPAAAGTP
jgi:formylglycine-generating enzyme required for sulfatase activity